MRRKSVIASLMLTLALAASVWTNCAAEMVISPMACCLAARQDCGPADSSEACCKAEQQIRHASIAARSERPDDGPLSVQGVLSVLPGLVAISPTLTVLPSYGILEAASSPPKYLVDSVLRV